MTRPTSTDWSDPASVREYMRWKLADWRARNPEKYRAGVARWRLNRKLRACGLKGEG
jgi:hypothetical protein